MLRTYDTPCTDSRSPKKVSNARKIPSRNPKFFLIQRGGSFSEFLSILTVNDATTHSPVLADIPTPARSVPVPDWEASPVCGVCFWSRKEKSNFFTRRLLSMKTVFQKSSRSDGTSNSKREISGPRDIVYRGSEYRVLSTAEKGPIFSEILLSFQNLLEIRQVEIVLSFSGRVGVGVNSQDTHTRKDVHCTVELD
jgi:hypothetical protein